MDNKLRLKFEKTGRAVYISHLDLMRTLQRMFFRAGLPLVYSEGFNPHAKISIILPLSVGVSSRCEFLDFGLKEFTNLQEIPERLNAVAPEGIRVLSVWPAETKGASLKWLELEGRLVDGEKADFYRELYSSKSLTVIRKTKRGEREEDIVPSIRLAEFEDVEDEVHCRLVLSAQEPTLTPELFLSACGDRVPKYSVFTRVQTYTEDGNIFS